MFEKVIFLKQTDVLFCFFIITDDSGRCDVLKEKRTKPY